MINTKFKSIDTVLERVLRSPLMNGIVKSDLAQDVAECLMLIGAPLSFDEKIGLLTVKDNRVALPCDLLQIIQTRRRSSGGSIIPMRYASDTFQSTYHKLGSPDFSTNSDSTYSINGGVAYTSFSEGFMEMMYTAVMVDKDGLPMIPDDAKFELAIEFHVKWRRYAILWEQQKISDKVFQHIATERDWYIGAASTGALMLNIDQSETFRASISRMIYDESQAKTGFVNAGSREGFNFNGQTRGGLGGGTSVDVGNINFGTDLTTT